MRPLACLTLLALSACAPEPPLVSEMPSAGPASVAGRVPIVEPAGAV